jgi:hypothetical protein
MKGKIIIIVIAAAIIIGQHFYYSTELDRLNKHKSSNTFLSITPPKAVVKVSCLTFDNVHIFITCTVIFKDMVVLDTVEFEQVVFLSARRIHSDSLSSQRCLNQLGSVCQDYFKDNDEVEFVNYSIEYAPESNTEYIFK